MPYTLHPLLSYPVSFVSQYKVFCCLSIIGMKKLLYLLKQNMYLKNYRVRQLPLLSKKILRKAPRKVITEPRKPRKAPQKVLRKALRKPRVRPRVSLPRKARNPMPGNLNLQNIVYVL